jgi:hypothetical protein
MTKHTLDTTSIQFPVLLGPSHRCGRAGEFFDFPCVCVTIFALLSVAASLYSAIVVYSFDSDSSVCHLCGRCASRSWAPSSLTYSDHSIPAERAILSNNILRLQTSPKNNYSAKQHHPPSLLTLETSNDAPHSHHRLPRRVRRGRGSGPDVPRVPRIQRQLLRPDVHAVRHDAESVPGQFARE